MLQHSVNLPLGKEEALESLDRAVGFCMGKDRKLENEDTREVPCFHIGPLA